MNQAVNPVGAPYGAVSGTQAERVSAAMDGAAAASDLDALIAGLRSSGDDAHWREYHLIGDLLRSDELAPVRPGFSAGVMARLDAEPTVLAPVLATATAHRRGPWMRWGLPGASVAAAAALIWVAVPRIAGTGNEAASIQASAGAATAQAQPTLVASPETPLVATGVDRYLIAHQQVSPSASRHGIAPMTRAVSYSTEQR